MGEAAQYDITHSAVRAFIGKIRPSFRRVSVRADESGGLVRALRVTVLVDEHLDAETFDDIREDVAVATTEIIADLPADTSMPLELLDEVVQAISGPLPPADILADGLIYQRWETV